MADLLTLRRRLCLEMAEQLQGQFHLSSRYSNWDTDEAAVLLDSILPSTRDEAILEDAQRQEQLDAVLPPRPPPGVLSLPDQLREVLGLDYQYPLMATLQIAIDRIKATSRQESPL